MIVKSDGFILSNVNGFDLGYLYSRTGVATLCECGCTFVPPITYIFHSKSWYMGNVKSRYILHEVPGYHGYGQTVTGLNPFTL